ncbi:hypothetical protein N7495_009728 [Penicillium taxi]|uniref:uncharacterized protein n=1 Tax=Penicillium taxi TaxID=168475 RepID=UPI002544F088|nr:uncharacterized protein N7495_009728 [Penicillium taxi]KAJ5885218.1 hypothetical protein N7495_009728 [Penicillium taxi]
MMAEEPLSSLVQTWLLWDQDSKTRSEVEKLRDAGASEELETLLRKRIEFGTAGLRGRMSAGFSRMNSLTVIQASQGLAKYIKTRKPQIASKGVVIGHDARHQSRRFAELAANAFIALQIPVWFFSEISPTPMVPYGINHWKAAAGVMVTASHNPPQDNGYKVYSSNGAQINRPEDADIAQFIRENLQPWSTAWDELRPNEFLHDDAYQTLILPYKEQVAKYAISTVTSQLYVPPFVYTPLHGVGGTVLPALCSTQLQSRDFVSAPLQEKPDPDFPTVKFPNPEEAGALDHSMTTADQLGRILVIANDPDADRFAVAEKRGNEWFQFTGDQIGVLLASHVMEFLDRSSEDPTKDTFLTTAVSSRMLEKLATARGSLFQETLTGFKWLGNVARDLEGTGQTVPFAYEEALGYMFSSICYDKDGITAAAVFLMAAAKWKEEGLTPYSKLEQLFAQHGFHETLNNYFRATNPELVTQLFRGIRSGPFLPEKKLGPFKILRWRDLTEGFDSSTADGNPDLPIDPTSQMLTLWLEGGVQFTLRGSGTEPKVKFYIECGTESRDLATERVCQTFYAIAKEWIVRYAPSIAIPDKLRTSSGHVMVVE